jgi:transposase
MVRDALVKTRTKYISLIRSIVRREGYRVPNCGVGVFTKRVEELALPENLSFEIEPLLKVMTALNEQIEHSTGQLKEQAESNEVTKRFCTVPGIGAITATTYLAIIDDIERFESASHVASYIGIVPREQSSSEKRIRGRITKAGNRHLRWLLVEAAWSIVTHPGPQTEYLRAWHARIASRRGNRIAAVALARKLAGILYAMWRDGTEFRAPHKRKQEKMN